LSAPSIPYLSNVSRTNTNEHHKDIDKAEVGDDRGDVDVHLLVRFQSLDVDTGACKEYAVLVTRATYVLRPDSVDALAPKK
jgi:hypothetical protein